MAMIPVQQAFDKEIPDNIRGNSEYAIEVEILQDMDRLLRESGMEDMVIRHWLAQAEAEHAPKVLSEKAKAKIQENATFALRAAVLRKYRKLSYREFARELALAPLYQWFCRLNRWGSVKIPAKSKLQADEQALPEGLVRELVAQLTQRMNWRFWGKPFRSKFPKRAIRSLLLQKKTTGQQKNKHCFLR